MIFRGEKLHTGTLISLLRGLYHKIDERDVDGTGVSYKFTDEELEILKGGLCDLANRIRKVADTL